MKEKNGSPLEKKTEGARNLAKSFPRGSPWLSPPSPIFQLQSGDTMASMATPASPPSHRFSKCSIEKTWSLECKVTTFLSFWGTKPGSWFKGWPWCSPRRCRSLPEFQGFALTNALGATWFLNHFSPQKNKALNLQTSNLQRASSSLNLNPFPRKKNPFPSRGSLSKLWWDVGNGVAGARLVPLQGLVVPSSLPFLQFHPESPQKSLQWQSLSKSSYMDELELGLGFLGAFCCWKPVVVVCGRGIDSHNFSRGGPSSERRRIRRRHYRPIFQIFFLLNNL